MPKYRSRATRCGDATADLSLAVETLQQIAEDLRADETPPFAVLQSALDKADAAFENGKSGVEELKEEIESWKENMEGANMEHLPKYEEVSECYDQLDSAMSYLDSVSLPELKEGLDKEERESLADELDSTADEIESGKDEADGASFPGMYS